MTAVFNELGIQFQYPDNWTLDWDRKPAWPRSVSVHHPDGAFWMVTESPSTTDLFEQVRASVTENYEDVESAPLQRTIVDIAAEGVELDFYCLDFLITTHIYRFPNIKRPLIVVIQAESREFEELADVFDAMTYSLLRLP